MYRCCLFRVPTSGAVSGRVTMIDILNTAEHDNILSDWVSLLFQEQSML